MDDKTLAKYTRGLVTKAQERLNALATTVSEWEKMVARNEPIPEDAIGSVPHDLESMAGMNMDDTANE